MSDDQLYILRRSLLRHFHDRNVQMIDHLAFKRTGCPIDPLGIGRPGLLIQLDDFHHKLIGRPILLMVSTKSTYIGM